MNLIGKVSYSQHSLRFSPLGEELKFDILYLI